LTSEERSAINNYVLDMIQYHTENQDAGACIALMEEFGEWIDREFS
jgi:hypothetical protein